MTQPSRLDRILSHLLVSREGGSASDQSPSLASRSCSSEAEILDVSDVALVQSEDDGEEDILFVGPLDPLLPGQRLRLRVADGHFLTRAFRRMLDSAGMWKSKPPTLGVVGAGPGHSGQSGTDALLEYGVLAELSDAKGPPVPGEVVEAGEDPSAVVFGPNPPLNIGDLIVAEPKMSRQPPFGEAVLLLVRHENTGTQAVIINKPLEQAERQQTLQMLRGMKFRLDDPTVTGAQPKAQTAAIRSYLDALVGLLQLPNVELRRGGDVGTSMMHVLHPFVEVQNAMPILISADADLYMSIENLSEVYARAREDARSKIVVFRGYAGWHRGQLAGEIRTRGSWGIAPASVDDVLHPEETSAFWQRIWRGCTHEKVNVFEFRATHKRFQLLGKPEDTVEEDPGGWGLLKVRVSWLNDQDELTAKNEETAQPKIFDVTSLEFSEDSELVRQAANELTQLIPLWCSRVKLHGHEAAPGHLDWVKESLGKMPSPEMQPGALAIWAAALLNPIPALGVAHEIRPLVLAERSTLRRIELVRDAFKNSIDGLGGQDIADALRRFEVLLSKPDSEIPLLQAAAHVGVLLEPQIDIEESVLQPVAELEEAFRTSSAFSEVKALPVGKRPRALADCLCEFFATRGFKGCRNSESDYYIADNSLIHRVLETRQGLPISLSLLYMTIGHAAGLELQGMNFPGHFLMAYAQDSKFELVDAFENRRLNIEETSNFIEEVYGQAHSSDFPVNDLQISKRGFVERMLRNLLEAYRRAGDTAKMARVAHCMRKLSPAK